MNKKTIIGIVIGVVLLIIVIVIIAICTKKTDLVEQTNNIKATISLETNECIELKIDEERIVREISIFNSTDNKYDKYKNDILEEVLKKIYTDNIDFFKKDDRNRILLNIESKENKDQLINNIHGTMIEGYDIDYLDINDITEEDKDYAKEHNVCYLKVKYSKDLTKENDKFTTEELIEKEVNVADEMVHRGIYCEDPAYTLEGDFCLKKIDEKEAKDGDVCPSHFVDYKGKCYEEVSGVFTGKYKCNSDQEKLVGTDCVSRQTEPATPQYACADGSKAVMKGEIFPAAKKDRDKYFCVSKEKAKAPTSRCWTQSNHISINGECYVGPAPLLGGGCPSPDIKRGNGCYSPDNKQEFVCPDGTWYEVKHNNVPDLCPDTFTYKEPEITGYICEREEFKLEGTTCVLEGIYRAEEIVECPSNSFNYHGRCLDKSTATSLVKGKYCDYKDSKLVNGKCYIYDIIEAKRK